MKKVVVRLAAPCLFVALLPFDVLAGAANGPIPWRTDFESARQEAQSSGKFLLVNIHATWCMPCKQLQATTLQDPKLAQMINQHAIPVSLDGDQSFRLLRQWGVQAFPTQLFIAPTGQVIGKIEGYVDVLKYAASFQQAATTYAASRPAPPAPQTRPAMTPRTARPAVYATNDPAAPTSVRQVAARMPAETPAPSQIPSRAPSQATLALDGHCPVSMIERAEMVPGSPSISHVHQGNRYYFLSEREKQLFEQEPHQYLPGENGNCVVTWREQGRWIAGNLLFPAIFGEDVFFFADEESQRKFLLDPEHYVDDHGNALRRVR
ncbi:thiol:disulfide interchange protein precursor [Planctomycetes bacterium Pan216]|uniref:Thiol:disulfide interchange protein n=1 Tax=Kolteria novifilia TaxID=2527975 RepID=A0A518B9K3_9BACT|nr:thiol:disulfide interchange protein precursor [Planctomycetes bacterium Pan216]